MSNKKTIHSKDVHPKGFTSSACRIPGECTNQRFAGTSGSTSSACRVSDENSPSFRKSKIFEKRTSQRDAEPKGFTSSACRVSEKRKDLPQNPGILQKPFLKWVGGKTQIINKILNNIPESMNNYHEPFLGGGSVLFAILSLKKYKKINIKNNICAYDINYKLINVYKNIQDNPDKLWIYIDKYYNKYKSCQKLTNKKKSKRFNAQITNENYKDTKEHYYYWLRAKFNNCDNNSTKCAALFIIINKISWRGVYRENSNGLFNVPFGNYKRDPKIITKDELNNISKLIKNVKFICANFENSLKNVKNGDFVYLDPPYVPVNTSSFVSYNKCGFTLENHQQLFELIKKKWNKCIKIMISNANADLVINSFKYIANIHKVDCKRHIHSKNPGAIAKEIIIMNYIQNV